MNHNGTMGKSSFLTGGTDEGFVGYFDRLLIQRNQAGGGEAVEEGGHGRFILVQHDPFS